MKELNVISPRSGTSFTLKKGQRLKVVDIEGEQVSDLMCFNLHDRKEVISSGRTIDFNETILVTAGHDLYSNRSNVMLTIVEDTAGRHDFIITPCSADTFRKMYDNGYSHKGCFGNLCEALSEYGIEPDQIPVTFNIFMYVDVNGDTGKVEVRPPKTKAGDYIILEAQMDLIIGLTACAAPTSNNGTFKPIGHTIIEG